MSRRSMRFGAMGVLIGFFLGVVASLIFPDINSTFFQFSASNPQTAPVASYKSGSVFNTFMYAPLLLGVICGILGIIISKVSGLRK